MDDKAKFLAKDQAGENTLMRKTSWGWVRIKWMPVAAFLSVLVMLLVVGVKIWFFTPSQESTEPDHIVLLTLSELNLEEVPFEEERINVVNNTVTTRRPLQNNELSPEERLRLCLRGVVTVEPGGRFGNQFMEWASAWAVARSHNLTLATPLPLQNTLYQAFSRVPTGPSIYDMLQNCTFGPGLRTEDVFENVVHENESEAAVAFAAAVAKVPPEASPPGPFVLQFLHHSSDCQETFGSS